jgi:hypothetical protein
MIIFSIIKGLNYKKIEKKFQDGVRKKKNFLSRGSKEKKLYKK